MSIAMPDSIYPENLPPGYSAYLGYADGKWPTAAALRARFPGAHIISLTVTARTSAAVGIDVEPGNPDAASGASWAALKLAADPHSRPVIYASVRGTAGYGMPDVLAELARRSVPRSAVRLHSAHYTGSPHICGPASCGAISTAMDGTQWTSSYRGVGGALIDMSVLRDDFFGAAAPQATTEVDVTRLPVLRQGSSGQAVRNWQGLLVAHAYGYLLGGAVVGNVMEQAGVDGQFGAHTAEATVKFKEDRKLPATSVVDAQTWAVGLG